MAVAEPSGQLWQRVGPMIGGWPDSDEDRIAAAADGWDAAAAGARTAMAGARQSAAGTRAAWADPAGTTLAGALETPERTARLGAEFGRLAGQTRTFAESLRATKSTIAGTIAVNEPLYQMALAVPGTAAGDFATAVAGHLNAVIDQAAGQIAGAGDAATVADRPPPGPGAADLAAARDEFFGPPAPGVARQVLRTGAIVPGGQDGVLVSRFFIADPKAAFGYLYGDDRGPTTDPHAGNRFSVAWDTRTGEVSLSVQPSSIDLASTVDAPIPIDPDTYGNHAVVTPALPITVGPGGDPNNFVVNRADAGGIDVSYNLLNSGDPVNNLIPGNGLTIGEANGRVQISLAPGQIQLTNVGDDYPDGEFIQYRDGGTRLLGSKAMSPLRELAPGGSDLVPVFGQGSYLENIPR